MGGRCFLYDRDAVLPKDVVGVHWLTVVLKLEVGSVESRDDVVADDGDLVGGADQSKLNVYGT